MDGMGGALDDEPVRRLESLLRSGGELTSEMLSGLDKSLLNSPVCRHPIEGFSPDARWAMPESDATVDWGILLTASLASAWPPGLSLSMGQGAVALPVSPGVEIACISAHQNFQWCRKSRLRPY